MRHVRWPILLACLSIPVLGQTAPHSIYENIASMEAIGGDSPSTNSAAVAPSNSNTQQSEYDAAKQRFDGASDQLMYARNDVVNRLANDSKFQAANRSFGEAKNRYDDEIDEVLSALSYDDEYQEEVDAANRAGANLQSLNEFAAGKPDQQSVQYAQQRADETRKAVEDDEDNVLDHDKYVQQARQKFEAARAARDRILSDAFAGDQKVQEAQANVNREQIALDAAAGSLAQNSSTAQNGPQAPTHPLPTVEGVQPPPSAYETAGSQGPVIYDAGDGTVVGPSYVPQTYVPAYSYDADLNSPYDYTPYYSYYPYGYPGGVFLYSSGRDRHRYYYNDHEIWRYHDRRDGNTWTRGSDGRHVDWNDGRDVRNVPAVDGAQLAADRQAADTSQNHADEVRQREEWRERMSQQTNDAAGRQGQTQTDQQQNWRSAHVWTGRNNGDPQPQQSRQSDGDRQAAAQQQQQQQQQQRAADQQAAQQQRGEQQQQQAESNAQAQQASAAQSRAAQQQQQQQQQQAAQAQQSRQSGGGSSSSSSGGSSEHSGSSHNSFSGGGGGGGGHSSGGGGDGGGSHHH